MLKKLIALLLCLLLTVPALAETAVEDRGLDLLGSSVRYPYLTEADEAVNALLIEQSGVGGYLDRLSLLAGGDASLTVTYRVRCNEGGIFSCAFFAEGALETTRVTNAWTAVNLDTETGESVTLNDLFTDPEAAAAWLEGYLEEEVGPALSPHLLNSDITPLPEAFTVDCAGITFYYPVERLRLLSDRAGAVQVAWYQLRDFLRLGEGTVLERIGAEAMLGDIDGDAIAAWLEKGTLPGLPVALGDSLQDATDAWKMLNDNDMITGARVFELEDAAFRDVLLLTDTLTEDWDNSLILGIRSGRIDFCGLITGETTLDAWRAALGEPDATLTLDETEAADQRLTAGTSDYYVLGGRRLRLHADENGVLQCVQISD